MHSGRIFWMMNSFMHTNMGWCLYAGTISRGGSSLESLLIQQIIQRSVSTPYLWVCQLKCGCRVLIANIRNLGNCPCPRCLIPKLKFQDVATENDILQRSILMRHDMVERREKILCARRLIYEEQYVIDTPQVKALLKPESLVPTIVCFLRWWGSKFSYYSCPECVFRKAESNRFWLFPDAGCWLAARVWIGSVEICLGPPTSYSRQP